MKAMHPSKFFYKFKLRDLKWSIILTIIIVVSILSFFTTSQLITDVKANIRNYSNIATYIRVDHISHYPGGENYVSIPDNIVNAVESIPHVERVYRIFAFELGYFKSINIPGLGNTTTLLMSPAIIVGLDNLSQYPPFLVDVWNGSLPRNGYEIALPATPGFIPSMFRIGSDIKVGLDFNRTAEVRVSGYLTQSFLTGAILVVHKDFLNRIKGGNEILEKANSGVSNILFIKVDNVYNVNDVLYSLKKILSSENELGIVNKTTYNIIYDGYLVKKTILLNNQARFLSNLLVYGSLSISAVLIILINYFSINIRRWELGLLRSIGYSNGQITSNYLIYIFILTIAGLLSAIALFYIIGGYIESWILNVFNLSSMVSITTIQLSSAVILLSFSSILIISIFSMYIMLLIALRRPVEYDLREF